MIGCHGCQVQVNSDYSIPFLWHIISLEDWTADAILQYIKLKWLDDTFLSDASKFEDKLINLFNIKGSLLQKHVETILLEA